MTKNDKVFFTGLIKGLEGRLDKRFEKIDGRFEKIDRRFEKIDGRMENQDSEIRRNGIMLEELKGDFKLMGEGFSLMNDRMGRMETDISEIKNTIIDYPFIREMVKKHDRQLAKLSK